MQALVRFVQPTHESAFIQKFLDLVACGTVADVMPLLGENRVFASFGLKQLAVTRKVGLRALLDGAGIKTDKPLSAEAVGFGLGPRINAVGRLDDAAVALDLLLTGDPEEARQLVEKMNAFNVERQQAQRRILEEAKLIVAGLDLDRTKVLVIASPGWNAGVVGIVAGKLVDAYYRPAIVIGVNDEETHGKGSARSIAGFDMFKGIQLCRDLLQSCGGHEMAAGLSLTMDNLADFSEKINAHARATMSDEDFVPRLDHDGTIDPSALSLDLLEEWARFAPFGHANPEPKFASQNLLICDARRIGKDMTHLKMRVRAEAMDPTDCIAWGQGDWADRAGPGDFLEAVYTPQINEWNGRRLLQFNIKDLRHSKPL